MWVEFQLKLISIPPLPKGSGFLERISMKTRDIVIDADHILFFVSESRQYKDGVGGESLDNKINLKPYKKHFKEIVLDYVKSAEVLSITHDWSIGDTKVVLSSKLNFRYKLYPEYKAGRSKRSKLFYKLQKWARGKYTTISGCEADEVCCYYVREKGALGFSTDKDVLNTEGIWYNTHHMHKTWATNTKKEAYMFMLEQVLAGDPTDNIKGLSGVGLITARKLLLKFGYDWNGVLAAYLSKDQTSKDALFTRNLVDMCVWSPQLGLKIYDPKRAYVEIHCDKCKSLVFRRADSIGDNLCVSCSHRLKKKKARKRTNNGSFKKKKM